MVELIEILKRLSLEHIDCSLQYNIEKEQFFIDLQTEAKSELHLYDDGIIRGRYDYENQIDLNAEMNEIIINLCFEFRDAFHGRNYGQSGWFDLCKRNNVKIKVYGK
jgi:hypothetical protein